MLNNNLFIIIIVIISSSCALMCHGAALPQHQCYQQQTTQHTTKGLFQQQLSKITYESDEQKISAEEKSIKNKYIQALLPGYIEEKRTPISKQSPLAKLLRSQPRKSIKINPPIHVIEYTNYLKNNKNLITKFPPQVQQIILEFCFNLLQFTPLLHKQLSCNIAPSPVTIYKTIPQAVPRFLHYSFDQLSYLEHLCRNILDNNRSCEIHFILKNKAIILETFKRLPISMQKNITTYITYQPFSKPKAVQYLSESITIWETNAQEFFIEQLERLLDNKIVFYQPATPTQFAQALKLSYENTNPMFRTLTFSKPKEAIFAMIDYWALHPYPKKNNDCCCIL